MHNEYHTNHLWRFPVRNRVDSVKCPRVVSEVCLVIEAVKVFLNCLAQRLRHVEIRTWGFRGLETVGHHQLRFEFVLVWSVQGQMHKKSRVCWRTSVTVTVCEWKPRVGSVGSRGWTADSQCGEPTSLRLWAGVACEALRNETQFTTTEVDILASPDCVSWIRGIAVQLLDVVSDRGAYFICKSKVAERRSTRIKVFCDRYLPDELTVPDMQEEKRRRYRRLFLVSWARMYNENKTPILPPWRSGS